MTVESMESRLAALRTEGDVCQDESAREASLGRILVSIERDRSRRRVAVGAMMSIAVLLIGSSAWAAVTGRLPGLLDAARGWVNAASVESRAVADRTDRGAAAADSVLALAGPAPGSPTSLVLVPPAQSVRPDAGAQEEFERRPDTPTVSEVVTNDDESSQPSRAGAEPHFAPSDLIDVPARPDRALALYARAHEAHFRRDDMQGALDAWNAYLAFAPRGTFAPEAHFNRGVALARLGRTREARAALEPFAQGAFADYRRQDAAAILERLDDTDL